MQNERQIKARINYENYHYQSMCRFELLFHTIDSYEPLGGSTQGSSK